MSEEPVNEKKPKGSLSEGAFGLCVSQFESFNYRFIRIFPAGGGENT